jgi:FkbM family methyltransferase
MDKIGTDYSGFYYPKNLDGLDENSIIYCIGAGEDISHDIILANKLNSNVYIIDPTPRAIKHIELVKNVLEGKESPIFDKKIGGGRPYEYWKIILENKIDINKIKYINYGISNNEGKQKFYLPTNEEYVSCSLVEGMKSDKYIEVNVKKLRSIMNELDHNKIDLLKMDIEGSECDVIENMLEDKIYPKYLAVEFDNTFKKENTKNLLEKNDYKLLYQDNNNYVYKYNINVCIIHIGYKKYLEENIKITSKTNKIYLIGDESVKCLEKYENVEYVDIEEFMKNEKISYYKSKYINYSDYAFNWIWIAGPGRIFTIQLFIKKYKLNHIFNIDSDCVLLENINNYPFKHDIAYCINKNYKNKYRMSNSIHCALLNNEFCIEFEKLYNDLYINKSKFKLIEEKINYHKINNIPGGICEMTLCYLLQNENYIIVDNLLEIRNHRNKKITFMNTLYANESSKNKDQYLKENNIIKLYDINGKKNIYDKINETYVELWNIHYQGDCKILLELELFSQ